MRRSGRNRTRATAAFRRWALAGCPDIGKIRAGKKKGQADLVACAVVFAMLSESAQGREIMAAVRTVYMEEPSRNLHRNEVTMRVRRFSVENYVSERTVYYRLGQARKMWCQARDRAAPESLQ